MAPQWFFHITLLKSVTDSTLQNDVLNLFRHAGPKQYISSSLFAFDDSPIGLHEFS